MSGRRRESISRGHFSLRRTGAALVCAGAVACTGGPGDGGELMTMWSSPGSSSEYGGNTWEPVASGEPANVASESAGSASAEAQGFEGAPGGGGLVCPATYRCAASGKGVTVTLVPVGGGCRIVDEDEEDVILRRDGTVIVDGKPEGTWSGTASGIRVSVKPVAFNCVRGGDGGEGQGGAPPQPPPTGGESGGDGNAASPDSATSGS